MPLRKFHCDALRSRKKDQLSVMEVHDFVPKLNTRGCKPCHFSIQVVNCEADMVVAQFREVANSWIWEWVWMMILK